MTAKQHYYIQHREEILTKAKARHLRDWRSATYRRLCATRKTIYNYKRSISNLRDHISKLQVKLWRANRKKEELELEWGAERARRKREQKGTAQAQAA